VARRFHADAVSATFIGLFVALAPPGAGAAAPLLLDVLVIDAVGTPAPVLAEAQRISSRIFGRLDVRVVWLDTDAARRRREALDGPAAERAFMKSLYAVRVVAPGGDVRMPSGDTVLGSAALGTRVVTINYVRVDEEARSAGAPTGLVLGHVIAHELGHLLLGRNTHAAAGLMQPTVNVPLAQQGRLVFTDDEARQIRTSIARDAATR
jgi:hypothetical protein